MHIYAASTGEHILYNNTKQVIFKNNNFIAYSKLAYIYILDKYRHEI